MKNSRITKVIGIGLVLVLLGISVFGQEDTKNNKDKTSRSNATVNPTSLGLELSIPLGNSPGRAGNSLPITFNYSSKVWRMNTQTIRLSPDVPPDTYALPIYNEDSDSGWTTSLQAPYLEDSSLRKVVQPNPTPTPPNTCPSCLPTPTPNPTPTPTPCVPTTGHPCSPTPTPLPTPTHNPGGGTPYGQVGGGTPGCPSFCSYCFWDWIGHWCTIINPQTSFIENVQNTLIDQGNAFYLLPKLTLHLPDGSTHELVSALTADYYNPGQIPPTPTKYFSIDGSNLRYEGGILYMPNGSRYEFAGDLNTYIVNYFDADGNKLTYSVNRSGNYTIANLIRHGVWTDTLGRTVLPPKAPTDPTDLMHPLDIVPGSVEYNVPTLPGHPPMTYIFKWKRLENSFAYSSTHPNYSVKLLSELFSDVAIGNYHNPVVLQEIEQPNGKKYQFFYNEHGEIEKIIYPTESSEEFTYEPIPPFSYGVGLGSNNQLVTQGNRGVVQRIVKPDNLAEHDMKWTYKVPQEVNSFKAEAPYRVITTAPDLSYTERYLFISPQSSNSVAPILPSQMGGKPYEERSYDRAGKLVSRSLTKWAGVTQPIVSGGGSGCQVNCGGGNGNNNLTSPSSPVISYPKVEKQISISIEGDKALATLSESEYDANADPMFFAQMNVKRAKSYGYVPLDVTQATNNNFASIQALFTADKLLGSSETDYLYDANYKARGILGLPIESRSFYKNEPVPISKTQTIFDDTAVETSDVLTGNAANTWVNPLSTLRGKPTTSRVWNNDTNSWIETKTFYDQYGNVRKTKTPTGIDGVWNVSQVEYSPEYACAYPTKTISPAPSADGIHGTTATSEATMTYDPTTGLPLTVTDEYNQTVKTEYDAYLRPKKVSGVYPFVIPITETFYDDDNLRWVKVRKQIDEQNWDEATSFSDSLGRTIKTQAKDSQGDVFTETKYDNLGRVEKTSNPYREGETIYWSKPRYDELNRVVETFAPALENQTGASLGVTEFGISTVQDYVGTYTTATDASGRRARSITNALGQLVRIDEPTGTNDLGTIDAPNQPTFYKYNPQGKMVKVSQGQQNRYFLYDYLGRLIRVRQPEQEVNTALDLADTVTNNNQWTAGFEYDIVGNLKKTTDAKGSIITNSYDKAGRVTERTYSNEPQGVTTPNVEYFYDGKGITTPQTPNYAKGKLTKVTSSISETRYNSFDNFGRLLQMEQRTPFDTETIANATPRVSSYQYDFGGRLVAETYPSGRVVKNEFNADGDLSRIASKTNATAIERQYASGFAYTADGKIQRLKLGSGVWESAKFDSRFQVTEMSLGSSNGNGSLWKLNYEYGELDANGNTNTTKNTGNISKQIISYQGLAQPFVQSFKYDALDRITEAKENNGTINGTQNWKQTFDYDRFGNRTSFNQIVGTQQLTINNQTLPSVDASSNRFNLNQGYIFDKNGNIIQDGASGLTRKFTFNADNKQTEVKNINGALIGNYFYDGEGNRVKKVTQTETTIFVYSNGKLVAEYSTAAPPTDKQTRYFGTDQLVTPRVITNQNGQVISRRDYMPFGEEISINRPTNDKYGVLDDGVRQGFTNYEKDKETDLDFAEARMYNNKHGRFTAVDPLLASGKSANPQTFNRYIYTMNRPTVLTDPSGMQTTSSSTSSFTSVKPCTPPNCTGSIANVIVPISFGGDLIQNLAPLAPLAPLILPEIVPALAPAAPAAGIVACGFCAYLLADRISKGPIGGNYGNVPFLYQGQRAISNTGGIANIGPATSYFNNTRNWAIPTTATTGSPTANPAPSPSPFARPNPFGNPNPSPSPTATPDPNSCPCLVRFGVPETAQELRTQAEAAQNNGFPYGVSTKFVTKISGSDRFNRWAPLSQVQTTFTGTRQTGNNPNHFTVVFPRAVDQDIANIFNTLFIYH